MTAVTEPEIPTEKWCSRCERMRPLDDFPNHKGRKHGKGAYCNECNRSRVTSWQQENPKQATEKHRVWRHTPHGKARLWAYRLMERYGITPEDYWRAWDEQGGACAICRAPFEEVPHADHNHETKIFRGLLCRGCNHGLGSFGDEVERLLSAATYLIERSGRVPVRLENGTCRSIKGHL